MKTGWALLLAAVLVAGPLGARAQEAQPNPDQTQTQPQPQQEEGAAGAKNQKAEGKVIKKSDCKYSGIPGKWSRDHAVGPDSPDKGKMVKRQ